MGLEILCAIVAVIIAFYYYCTANYSYWKNLGVKGPKPLPLVGNFGSLMTHKVSMLELLDQTYKDFKDESFVGLYARRTPVLVVRDLDFIKDVLIRDFSKFSDRGIRTHKQMEPLSESIFTLSADKWKPLRNHLSPVFTSGKLKDMFPLILECSEQLKLRLQKDVAKGEPIECRDLMAKFTVDVIGSCAFGLDTHALSSNEGSEFHELSKKIFKPTLPQVVRIRFSEMYPTLYNLLGYVWPYNDVTKFFLKSIRDTLDYRRKHKIVRHDFVDNLIQLEDNPEKLGGNIEITTGLLASQAFVFFGAGFETSSTTMAHVLYELAQNPTIQDKLREEIRQQINNDDGAITYDGIKKMKYLDKVFRETLRKYPPGFMLFRQAVEDYRFEGTNVVIPKGSKVFLPIYAIQHDPKYFPNPEVFDPERFSDEMVKSRHPMTYMPFGDGPRNCIGARFAVNQSKIGLIIVLRDYKVDVCEKTTIPYVSDPRSFILIPKGGVHLKLTKAD